MAKKKILEETTQQQAQSFQPVRLDEFATQISPTQVSIEGLDTLVSYEEYMANKELETRQNSILEHRLLEDVRSYIRKGLLLRTGTWQEDCRGLSWAYAAQGNPALLRKIVEICPSMALGRPGDSVVTMHHISHMIRAFLAVHEGLSPASSGTTPCILYNAQSTEQSTQNKIIVWRHLLSLREQSDITETKPARTGALAQILQQQQEILERLAIIETLVRNRGTEGSPNEISPNETKGSPTGKGRKNV